MSRWFRHYAGMMRDEKLVRVAIKSKQPVERVLWIWGAILESAAEVDDDGRYDLDPAEVAYFLRADQADVDAIITAFTDAGRLADGVVVKWGDRQFSSDRSRDRVAAHRARKRAEKQTGNDETAGCNGDVTLHNRYCIAPETETDTETYSSGSKEPSPRARKSDPFPRPDWADPQHWNDLKANRKAKRLPNTATAHAKLLRDIDKLVDDDWPPGRLLEAIVARGWAAAYDPRENRNDRPQQRQPFRPPNQVYHPSQQPSPSSTSEKSGSSSISKKLGSSSLDGRASGGMTACTLAGS